MRLIAFITILAMAGCQRQAASPPPGPKSPTGWQVRYNAAQALAHRGSPQIKDPAAWESFQEMLDEEQQLRNFTQSRNGRDVCDTTAARMTVIGALRAVAELHRRQPALDLAELTGPITKLTQSSNVPLSTEAKHTQLVLTK